MANNTHTHTYTHTHTHTHTPAKLTHQEWGWSQTHELQRARQQAAKGAKQVPCESKADEMVSETANVVCDANDSSVEGRGEMNGRRRKGEREEEEEEEEEEDEEEGRRRRRRRMKDDRG